MLLETAGATYHRVFIDAKQPHSFSSTAADVKLNVATLIPTCYEFGTADVEEGFLLDSRMKREEYDVVCFDKIVCEFVTSCSE